MPTFLRAIPFLKRLLGTLFLLLLVTLPGQATHLLGGEMSYRYLGPAQRPSFFRYEVTVLVYVNAGPGSLIGPLGRDYIEVGFYSKTAPRPLLNSITIPRQSVRSATPAVVGCPGIPPAPPVNVVRYVAEVTLPASFDGYYALYTDNARNIGITNILQRTDNGPGGDSGNMTLSMDVAPPLLPNSSPIFTDTAVAVICQGEISSITNNAFDPDGDRLVYSFGTPYGGNFGPPETPLPNRFALPVPPILYAPGYSASAPFGTGPGNAAYLNATTGLSQYTARNAGTYVVAVDVDEYRRINGVDVLIGRSRRDIQLITRRCPDEGGTPVLDQTAARTFTVEEGQPLRFPIGATATPAGTPVTVRVNSVLLDGSGGFNATYNGQPGTRTPGQFTGIVSLSGVNAAGADLVFTPRCGDARATPYDIVVTATAPDCKRKSVSDVFQVRVTRPPGPNVVSGERRVCLLSPGPRTYTAGGPVPASYRWRVQGGTFVGATTSASVQVQWGSTVGTGRLVVVGYTALGCPTDSVVTLVELTTAPVISTSSSAASICQGTSVQLQAALSGAPSNQIYTWTGGGQTWQGASVTVSPAVTTTYTVTTLNPAGDACPSAGQITVVVTPIPVAVAGPALALCSGLSGQLGTAPVAGVQYQWSPTEGLSNPGIANPTFILTNSTGAPRTLTYTLTASAGPGCQSTATVAVTVNPAAVATPGPARTLCSGETGQLGGAAVAGTAYLWSPALGLSDATVANPTVTLTNTGTTVITQTYTLTATTARGCGATATVQVSVNPAVITRAVPVSLCSGATASLGGAAVAGYTYQWSPATGLSNPTSSNPTVTLTNLTNAPVGLTYTLTTTTAEGCVAITPVLVTVNPAAVANAGPAASICADEQLTLGSPPLPGYTYQWSPATGLSSATVAQPVLTARNVTGVPALTTYTLTATTAQGCVAAASVVVTVNPRPVPVVAILGPLSVCPTVTGVTYTAQVEADENPALPLEWNVQGGTLVSGQGTRTITVDWGLTRADAQVQVLTRNAQGCASTSTTLPVRINVELQTARPTGPLQVCQADGPNSYQTTYTNGSSYSWTIVGGTQVSTSGASVVVRWDQPGLGQLSVRETSNPSAGIRCLGQSETILVDVMPSPLATLTIQGPVRACVNSGPITFALPGGGGTSTYAFELNGVAVAATGSNITLPTATLTPGAYTLTARETNAKGCAGPLYTAAFTIDPRPALSVISGPAFVCPEGLSGVRYTVASTVGSSYAWTITGGGTITAGQGSNSITVAFEGNAAAKTITVAETSVFGCAGPTASLTVTPDQAQVLLHYVTVDPQDNGKVQVYFDRTHLASTTQPVHLLRRTAGATSAFAELATMPNTSTSYVDATAQASQQAYDYQLEVTNACGTVLRAPAAHTSIRLAVAYIPGVGGRQQGTATLTWNAYLGFAVQQYRVYRVVDQQASTLLTTVLPGQALTYTTPTGNPQVPSSFGLQQCFYVEAVQSPNAAATSYVSRSNRECVGVESPLAFYNIITPNHDGRNDVFTIDNVVFYPGNTLSIFDRWGQQVYATTNYANTWGGDEHLAAGVYYYLFKLADGTQHKGWVEVVK